MEVILEVVRADGTRTWHRVDTLPLTIGRGFSNDLVLDDPYVDARHATIARDASGALLVEDLGSVNGIVVPDGARARRVRDRVPVHADAPIRLGRTTLRFHAPDDAVAPALVDEPAELPAALPAPRPNAATPGPTTQRRVVPRVPRVPRWATTTPGRLLVVAAAMGAFALSTWLGSFVRTPGSDVFTTALAFVMASCLWAGLWAIGGRAVGQRARFLSHLAIVAAIALGALACTVLSEWLTFLFPDATVPPLLPSALMFALLAALVAGHLALSSAMATRRRWTIGLVVAGTAFGIGVAAALAKEDAFTDVPRFSSMLKPLPAAWLPTHTVDEFGGAMRDLRHDVDELADEQAKRRDTR